VKKLLFILTTLALTGATTVALAYAPVTRTGSQYSGIRNPGNCTVEIDDKHPTELRADCRDAEGDGAYVRFRFLKDVGAIRDAATISADLKTWVGADCFAEWMVKTPKTAARTLRVTVPAGTYCHIRSVGWSQP
jgi:hypothetical protein